MKLKNYLANRVVIEQLSKQDIQAIYLVAEKVATWEMQNIEKINCPTDMSKILMSMMRNQERECFGVVFLDNQHGILGNKILFKGTLAQANVFPREIVKQALYINAAALIIYHQHPSSGISDPSVADIRITARIKQALATVDIPLLDHLILGKADVTSLAETGQL